MSLTMSEDSNNDYIMAPISFNVSKSSPNAEEQAAMQEQLKCVLFARQSLAAVLTPTLTPITTKSLTPSFRVDAVTGSSQPRGTGPSLPRGRQT